MRSKIDTKRKHIMTDVLGKVPLACACMFASVCCMCLSLQKRTDGPHGLHLSHVPTLRIELKTFPLRRERSTTKLYGLGPWTATHPHHIYLRRNKNPSTVRREIVPMSMDSDRHDYSDLRADQEWRWHRRVDPAGRFHWMMVVGAEPGQVTEKSAAGEDEGAPIHQGR